MVSSAASHALPPCCRHAAKATTTSTTGVNRAVAYFTASAVARMMPALTRRLSAAGMAVCRPDTQPGRQREQKQRHGVKGREGAEELRAGEGSEQRRSQQRRPLAVQPDRRGPQQTRDPEHEAQRQNARGSQAADAVRQGAQRRVENGRAGEVGGEVRDRRLVQPPGPFQVPGPQVQGLVLECRVGPDKPSDKTAWTVRTASSGQRRQPGCARQAVARAARDRYLAGMIRSDVRLAPGAASDS